MRTRSSSNLLVESYPNPSSSNLRRHNRRRSKKPFILEESPVDIMADQRTMWELLRAPIEDYAAAIVVPPILAEQFELKHSLINMMTSDQFFGLEKDNPHDHIRWFNKITSTIIYKDVPNLAIKLMLFPFSLAGAARRWLEKEPPHSILTWEDLVSKFIKEFFPPQEQQIFVMKFLTFNNGLMNRFMRDGKDLLRTCPHHGFTDLHQLDTFYNALNPDNIQGYVSAAAVNYNQVVPLSELKKIKRMNEANMKAMQTQINNVKNELRNEMKNSIQASMSNQTNELKNMMASFFKMNIASTSGSGPLPSNTIANPKGELKAITTRSCIVLDGPSIPIPPLFINLEEDECASINLMPLSAWKKLGLRELISTRMTLKLANRAICTPVGIPRDVFVSVGKFAFPADFIIVDYESDPRVPHILGRPFLWTAHALIDVHGKDMILYLPSPHNINLLSGSTTSSSLNHLLEEFTDEPALITFPSGNDDLPFDIESDLKEIEYLLNHDPIKDMVSILEDSIDEDNLVDLNDNLVDTILEMFTDEHALNYSSPPLYDEYDDDIFEVKSDTEYVYDDPFDSKREKIKESKLLIDELDPFRSSDFLPSPEYDSFLFKDFSEVDSLPSKNNEDKGYKGLKVIKYLKAQLRFFLALLERTSASWMFLVSTSVP
nr:hypothetical protein [Tanacetum cinerariifolium]